MKRTAEHINTVKKRLENNIRMKVLHIGGGGGGGGGGGVALGSFFLSFIL